MAEDVVLMLSLSQNRSMNRSMRIWTCSSNKWKRSFTKSLRHWSDMEDAQPCRRRTRKKYVVDPEPVDDYPGGPHNTSLLWRYHVHVVRKAVDGVVFINFKLTLIYC